MRNFKLTIKGFNNQTYLIMTKSFATYQEAVKSFDKDLVFCKELLELELYSIIEH